MRLVVGTSTVLGVSDIVQWLPVTVASVVALPLDEVLEDAVGVGGILASASGVHPVAIKDILHLPFQLALDFHWFRWRREDTINLIAFPRRETVYMEGWMDAGHAGRKIKLVVKFANALDNAVGTKT